MDMLKCFLTVEVDPAGQSLPPEQAKSRKLFAGGEIRLGTRKTKQLRSLNISEDVASITEKTYKSHAPTLEAIYELLRIIRTLDNTPWIKSSEKRRK